MNKPYQARGVFSFYFMAVIVLFLTQSVNAAIDEKVIQKYIDAFTNKPFSMQITACKKLEWAGISDTRVFDLVEKHLLANYSNKTKVKANYNAWLAKALVFSGQEKYRPTLEKVLVEAGNKKVRAHVKKNIKNLNKYKQWNSIISDTSQADPSASARLNQYANMIRSGNRELQIVGAKRVNYEQLFNNRFILNVLDAEVKKNYTINQSDKKFVNAVAHMTKMLAASGINQYRATVETVASDAANKKIRKYAAGYLKKY